MSKKIIAFLTVLVLILSLALSAGFIIKNADHECSGASCRICAEIHALLCRLQETSAAVMMFFTYMFSLLPIEKACRTDKTALFSVSLVSLKVKLTC